MAELISKKEFDKIMITKGEVRGAGTRSYAEFIRKEEGEKGLKKLEEAITKLGYPVEYREIKLMDYYPIGLETVTLVAIQRLFNYDDKKFQEMGAFGIRLSLFFNIFMRYFVSPERFIKEAPKMWKEAGAIGNLKIVEYNAKKKHLILRIENFQVHSLYCQIFKGYFLSSIQMIFKSDATCEERKCPFRGDEYHEFLLKW